MLMYYKVVGIISFFKTIIKDFLMLLWDEKRRNIESIEEGITLY